MQPTRQSWKQIAGQDTFRESDDGFLLDPSIEQGFQASAVPLCKHSHPEQGFPARSSHSCHMRMCDAALVSEIVAQGTILSTFMHLRHIFADRPQLSARAAEREFLGPADGDRAACEPGQRGFELAQGRMCQVPCSCEGALPLRISR